jgi:hypothetical protein
VTNKRSLSEAEVPFIRHFLFKQFVIRIIFPIEHHTVMTFVEKHQCLERLKEWLRKGRGGNLKELAATFEVSTRTMKRWIAEIRKYEGWDVEYNRVLNRYVVRGMEKEEN